MAYLYKHHQSLDFGPFEYKTWIKATEKYSSHVRHSILKHLFVSLEVCPTDVISIGSSKY